MLNTLKHLSRKDATRLLASASVAVLPTPDDRTSDVSPTPNNAELLDEIRQHLRIEARDQSPTAIARIHDFLFDQLAQESLRGQRASQARYSLGFRGDLPPARYDVTFTDLFKQHSAHLGVRRRYVDEVLQDPDMVDHLPKRLESRHFDPVSLYWRARRDGPDPESLLVISARSGFTQKVFWAWRIFHSDVDLRAAASPFDIFRAFLSVYGVDVIVADTHRSRLFVDAVFSIPPTFRPRPGIYGFFNATTREGSGEAGYTGAYFNVSPLGVIEIAIAFALDVSRYAADLRKHGLAVAAPARPER